jgi:hypothetical protein
MVAYHSDRLEHLRPGRIWMQTRSPDEFIGWLVPKLPKQEGGGFRVG